MWPSPPLLPRKDNTRAHPTPKAGTPSWGHISPGPPGSSEETLGSPTNTLEVPGVSSLLHQGCCGGTWSQCWRCLLRGCKRKAPSFQHTTRAQPSRHHHRHVPHAQTSPGTRGFVLKTQPRLSPLAARSSWCQSPAREPEPVIFIRGCSLWGPSAASQEKQATGENLSLLMAFPPPAPAPAAV